MAQGIDKGQRQLALAQVVAHGLSHVHTLREVEEIIAQLEAHARELPVLAQSFHVAFRAAGREGTQLSAGREERGRLLSYDFVIESFVHVGCIRAVHLEQLAVGQRLAQFGYHRHHTRVLRGRCMLERLAQDIVSHEHGSLVVQEGVHRLLSPAPVALVHHIVMDQAGRMEQFERECRMVHLRGDLSGGAGGQEHHRGAHLLALAAQDMDERRVQQRVVVLQRSLEEFVETSQFRGYWSLYLL